MKMNNLLKTVIWVAIAAILVGGGFSAVHAYQAPLGPALNLAASAKAPSTNSGAEMTCGQTGTMTILFVGSDTSFGNPPYGADSIRLIKIDFDAQKVAVVAFPRDLKVQTEVFNNPLMAQQRLGLTFHYVNQTATGTPIEKNAAAARILAEIVLDDFAIRPDYYITIQMDSFAAMINTIGGVELTIPAAITTEHDIAYAAGKQTLRGALATEYVRFLNPGGEAARFKRQNDFVKAMQTKVISANILPQVPTLLAQLKDAVITDLSPEQIVSLACLNEKMPKGNVTFGAIDTPDLVSNDIPNIDAVKVYLAKFFGGN